MFSPQLYHAEKKCLHKKSGIFGPQTLPCQKYQEVLKSVLLQTKIIWEHGLVKKLNQNFSLQNISRNIVTQIGLNVLILQQAEVKNSS